MRKIILSFSILAIYGIVYAADPVAPATSATAEPAPAATTAAPVAPVAPAAPVASAPAVKEEMNLSGTWTSNAFGPVVIEQKNNKIVGTFSYTDDGTTQDCKIEGELKDKKITGKYWERPKVGKGEESRGDIELKLSDDGKTLTGWYREEGSKEKEDFNLNR